MLATGRSGTRNSGEIKGYVGAQHSATTRPKRESQEKVHNVGKTNFDPTSQDQRIEVGSQRRAVQTSSMSSTSAVDRSGTGCSGERNAQRTTTSSRGSQEKVGRVSNKNFNPAPQDQQSQWKKPQNIVRAPVMTVGTRDQRYSSQTPFLPSSISGTGQSESSISFDQSSSSQRSPSPYADALKRSSGTLVDPIKLLTELTDEQETSFLIRQYNHQISDCVDKNDIKGAYKIIDKMKEEGNKPNVYTFSPILNFYIRRGNENKVIETLQEMKRESVNSDKVIYKMLIDFYVSREEFSKASLLLDKLPESECFYADGGRARNLHHMSHGEGYMRVRNILAEQPRSIELIPGIGNHSINEITNMKEYIIEKIKKYHRNYECKPGSNEGRILVVKKADIDQRVTHRRGTL